MLEESDFNDTLVNPMENKEEIVIEIYIENYLNNKTILTVFQDATVKDENGKEMKRTELTAKEAFEALREKYSIDKKLSNKQARKIFVVREEIKNTGYNKYRSSTIASDVSDETVAYVEEMQDVLKDLQKRLEREGWE